jgi:hypothetical protein
MFNIFGTKPQEPVAPTQPVAGTPTQGANPPSQGATNPPASGQPNAQSTNTQPNPLDAYATMFNNANKAAPDAPPAFSLDAKTVSEVSANLDFTKDLPQEIMDKVLAGDSSAILQAINHVGRQAYATTLQHTTGLTDKFVGLRSEYDQKSVGSRVKSELTSQALSNDAPLHPLVKQELGRIAQDIAKANPDASPSEVAAAAKDYFNQIHSAMNPAANTATDAKTAGETDWGNYFK